MTRILQATLYLLFTTTFLPSIAQSGDMFDRTIALQKTISVSIPDNPPTNKILKVGDLVPNFGMKILNSDKEIYISDLKGKWVILDFWATWCYSCVAAFPKMSTLDKSFNGKLKVIAVSGKGTGDTEAKLNKFFAQREKTDKKIDLTFVVNDETAERLFPHEEFPHYVWISPTGHVAAITGADEVNASTIEKLLDNQVVNLPTKKDFFVDELMDLGANEPIKIDDKLKFYSAFRKGKMEGETAINSARLLRLKGDKGLEFHGIAMRNVSLLEMYETAIKYKELHWVYNHTRLRLEVKNVSELTCIGSELQGSEWEKENLYTYDLVRPPAENGQLYDYIISDLNKYSGFYGRFENRKVKCLVLKSVGGQPNQLTTSTASPRIYLENGYEHLEMVPAGIFVSWINKHPAVPMPVINDALPITINMVVERDQFDLPFLRSELAKCGLELVEELREIEVFVISDKKLNK